MSNGSYKPRIITKYSLLNLKLGDLWYYFAWFDIHSLMHWFSWYLRNAYYKYSTLLGTENGRRKFQIIVPDFYRLTNYLAYCLEFGGKETDRVKHPQAHVLKYPGKTDLKESSSLLISLFTHRVCYLNLWRKLQARVFKLEAWSYRVNGWTSTGLWTIPGNYTQNSNCKCVYFLGTSSIAFLKFSKIKPRTTKISLQP